MIQELQEIPNILVLNGGSSSIKFALYQWGDPPKQLLHGKVERIGLRGTTFTFNDPVRNDHENRSMDDFDHRSSANYLFVWLEKRIGLASITAVGHRIVNGGSKYKEPHRVTSEMLDELRRIGAYASEHLPAQIEIIDLIGERLPNLPQIACFDTSFHRDMPRIAKILPIPRVCRQMVSNATASTVCLIHISWRSSFAPLAPRPLRDALSSCILEMGRAWQR